MVATDVYCTRLLSEYDASFGWPGTDSPLFQKAVAQGLGTADLSRVEIIEFRV